MQRNGGEPVSRFQAKETRVLRGPFFFMPRIKVLGQYSLGGE
jgi:hypothetical protein